MIEIHGHNDVVCLTETREPLEQGIVWSDEVKANQAIRVGTHETGGVFVTLTYAPGKKAGATWAARMQQLDEGIEIPWPVAISNAPPGGLPDPKSYSVLVTIDCPLGTAVHVGKRKLSH